MDIYTLGNDIGTNRSRIYDSLRKFLFNFREVDAISPCKKKSGSFTHDRSSDPRQPTEMVDDGGVQLPIAQIAGKGKKEFQETRLLILK